MTRNSGITDGMRMCCFSMKKKRSRFIYRFGWTNIKKCETVPLERVVPI
jgi:hypothetical protein